MNGCCQYDQVKFKNGAGEIDSDRINKMLKMPDNKTAFGLMGRSLDEQGVEQMIKCQCDCHQDGIMCMC